MPKHTTSPAQIQSSPDIDLRCRFFDKVDKSGGSDACWIWIGSKNDQGYGKIRVGKKSVRSHRVSWELHNGAIPDNMNVLHNCPSGDNPSCVNPAHLWLGTAADNNRDMIDKGRNNPSAAPGERNSHAKLTEDMVKKIRRRAANGESQREISRGTGVGEGNISLIVLRKTWKHI